MKAKKNAKADLEKSRSVFFLIGIVVALAAVLVAFNSATTTGIVEALDYERTDKFEEDIVPIVRPPKEEIKPPTPKQVIETILIVENDEIIENEMEYVSNEADENTVIAPVIKNRKIVVEKEDSIHIIVSNPPLPPGGEYGLRKFIANNVKYPHAAREAGIEGKVYVRFCVTKSGKIDKVHVIRGVDPLLDNEAVNVVKKLPRWKPGEQAGRKVNVWYNLPIKFSLN